jgi:hypothetical protein
MVIVVVIVLAPNVAAMVIPFEAWPYTNAPMFAADIPRSTLYRPLLLLDGDKRFPTKSVRLGERLVQRLLLISAYGSTDPDTPFGFVPDDTPKKLEARLDSFFDRLVTKADKKQLKGATTLRLVLEERVTGERREIGRYDLGKHRFRHTWK